MGLDAVELLLSVEEAFGIEIPDAVAADLYTVGQLHQFILAERARLSLSPMPAEIAYDLLRNIIVIEIGVSAKQVTPQARFVQDLHID